MARPVRVLRWDDTGAPQRSPSNAASIVDILKKCLVDGYGTTDPLGWTLEFEDAASAVAVFRNSPVNGSGGYFRVSPYSTPTAAYFKTQSAMAATGPNFEDLFNPGYVNSIPADAALTRWILVGDDKSFFFMLHHSTSNFRASTMSVCMFIGDYEPVIPTDVATFICTGANDNSLTSVETVNFTTTNTGPLSSVGPRFNILNGFYGGADTGKCRIGIVSSVSGDTGLVQYGLYLPGENGESSQLDATGTDFPTGGIINNIWLKRDSTVSNTLLNGTDHPFIRGKLPGIIGLGWKTHADATWPVLKDIDGVEHLGVALNSGSASYGGIMVWINTEDWD